MTEKSKFLLATGAVCVLALTACGGGGGGGGEESAAPVEAPADYTLENTESTLASATVGGEQVSDVTPASEALSEGGSEAESAQAMLGAMMALVETDPEECKDPLFTIVSAGVMDGQGMSENLDQMVGGSAAQDIVVSARVMDSREAADQAVQDMTSSLDGCGDITLSAMGEEGQMTSSTSSPEIEGAGQVLLVEGSASDSGSTASPSGESTFSAASMSVGNLVVMVSPGDSMSVVDGGSDTTASPASEDELESSLKDLAGAFVDGPVEPTSSASPSAS